MCLQRVGICLCEFGAKFMHWHNTITRQAHQVRPNPSVKASPNSCACKPHRGQIVHRPLRGLHAPL